MAAWFYLIGIVSLYLTGALGDECAGQPDGNYEIGCRSFVVCKNQNGIIHNCPDPPNPHTVFNNATGKCDDPKNVPRPCGQWIDCTGHADKRYPDVWNQCHTYYTCQGETFFGHNICSPGLVFDSTLQTCNWPVNVAPPCGTKV